MTYEQWQEFVATTAADELARILWMTDAHGGFEFNAGFVFVNGAGVFPVPEGV